MTEKEFNNLKVGDKVKLSNIVFVKTNQELANIYFLNCNIPINPEYFENLRERSKKSLYAKILAIESSDTFKLDKPYNGMYLPKGAHFCFEIQPIEEKIDKLLKL